ncbi:MAG: hypothetical protein ACRDP6_12540 [Actinoallomurus sp.]
MLLPGLNLIYGLPGETHRTHFENLAGLTQILDAGLLCHRINVRQARAYPGTALAAIRDRQPPPSAEHFASWNADVAHVFDAPMKERVYPAGRRITGTHAFFVNDLGTWHRRLGSYSIQIVEAGHQHAGRRRDRRHLRRRDRSGAVRADVLGLIGRVFMVGPGTCDGSRCGGRRDRRRGGWSVVDGGRGSACPFRRR